MIEIKHATEDQTETAKNKAKDQGDDDVKRWGIWLTVAIAVAAFLQFGGIVGQICVYRKQSKLMLAGLRVSKKSANAAFQSSANVMNSQRAWVTVAIEQQTAWAEISVNFERHDWTSGLALSFKNCGDTPARIMDTYIRTEVVECINKNVVPMAPQLPISPDYSKPGYSIISPGHLMVPRQRHRFLVTINRAILGDDFAEWRVQQKVLCVFGFVSYRDVFEKDHVTRFCCVYQISRLGGYLTDSDGKSLFPPGFVMDGPDEYNEAT